MTQRRQQPQLLGMGQDGQPAQAPTSGVDPSGGTFGQRARERRMGMRPHPQVAGLPASSTFFRAIGAEGVGAGDRLRELGIIQPGFQGGMFLQPQHQRQTIQSIDDIFARSRMLRQQQEHRQQMLEQIPQARHGGQFEQGQPVRVHDNELVFTNPDGSLTVLPEETTMAMMRNSNRRNLRRRSRPFDPNQAQRGGTFPDDQDEIEERIRLQDPDMFGAEDVQPETFDPNQRLAAGSDRLGEPTFFGAMEQGAAPRQSSIDEMPPDQRQEVEGILSERQQRIDSDPRVQRERRRTELHGEISEELPPGTFVGPDQIDSMERAQSMTPAELDQAIQAGTISPAVARRMRREFANRRPERRQVDFDPELLESITEREGERPLTMTELPTASEEEQALGRERREGQLRRQVGRRSRILGEEFGEASGISQDELASMGLDELRDLDRELGTQVSGRRSAEGRRARRSGMNVEELRTQDRMMELAEQQNMVEIQRMMQEGQLTPEMIVNAASQARSPEAASMIIGMGMDQMGGEVPEMPFDFRGSEMTREDGTPLTDSEMQSLVSQADELNQTLQRAAGFRTAGTQNERDNALRSVRRITDSMIQSMQNLSPQARQSIAEQVIDNLSGVMATLGSVFRFIPGAAAREGENLRQELLDTFREIAETGRLPGESIPDDEPEPQSRERTAGQTRRPQQDNTQTRIGPGGVF